ncbi:MULTISPECIES: DUF6221 family protein [Streptomyces]|uniref:Uncharacterized protein n=2 Tax=Streptomyces TaxID=1883 RepID=A0A117IW69_9ACTN|nr:MULTISPECIES: DUF6221 family protein [Streptomyces]KUH38403.1 hypothetical protein ATE80_13115 [Streptomyces kanasensis]UUS30851.1 DUF6221 family protein [Streptomyces changanensis]
MGLIEFLRARLDEDRAVAEAAPAGPWKAAPGDDEGTWRVLGGFSTHERFNSATDTREITTRREEVAGPGLGAGGVRSEGAAVHMARHDPERVLAAVDAQRRILDEFVTSLTQRDKENDETFGLTDWNFEPTALPLLRLLALPYADHPDYQDEWRP